MKNKYKKINGFLLENKVWLSDELIFNKKLLKVTKHCYIEFIDLNDEIPVPVFFKVTDIIKDVDDGYFVICSFKGFKMELL